MVEEAFQTRIDNLENSVEQDRQELAVNKQEIQALQQQKSQLSNTSQDAKLRGRLDSEINQITRVNSPIGNRIDNQLRELNVLRSSGTEEEAQQRLAFAQRQRQARDINVQQQKAFRQDQRAREEAGATTTTIDLAPRKRTTAEIQSRRAMLERQREQASGGIFFKREELAERGIDIREQTGEPTSIEKQIQRAEEIVGVPVGTSGVGFIAGSSLPPKSRSTILSEIVAEQKIKFRESKPVLANIISPIGFDSPNIIKGMPPPLIPAIPISSIQGIRVLGVTQRTGKAQIITTIGFKTSKGLRGTATGVTQIIGRGKGVTLGTTRVTGTIGRTAIKLPKGTIRLLQPAKFQSVSASLSTKARAIAIKDLGGLKVAKSFDGAITGTIGRASLRRFEIVGGKQLFSKGTISAGFKSITASLKGGQFAGVTGTTRQTGAFSRGFIKTVKTQPTSLIKFKAGASNIITAGKPLALKLRTEALSTLVGGVRGSVSLFPFQASRVPAIVTTLPLVTGIKPSITTALPKTISTIKTSITPTLATTRLQTKTFTATRNIQSAILSSSQLTKQIARQRAIQTQKGIQTAITSQVATTIPIQAQSTRLRQVQILKTITPAKTTTAITSFPLTPFRPIGKPLRIKRRPTISTRGATFGVAVRRFGKFRTIGSGLSISQAISVGTQRVSRGLGATFKITPLTKGTITSGIKTPRGFKRGKGLTFVEQPKFRLSTGTEVKAIQLAKGGIKI